MPYPNAEEATAQRDILRQLAPVAVVAERSDALFSSAMTAIAQHPVPGAATKVGLILFSRLANDIRVCGLAASVGYGLQAFGLAASIMEILGALAFVGNSEERAIEWAEHADRKRSYPRMVNEGIDAALGALDIAANAAREDWQNAYTSMCMAKHANPRLSMLQGLQRDPAGLSHLVGPDTSPLGVFLSAEALNRALGYGSAGLYVAAPLCSMESVSSSLRADALSIRDQLRQLHPWLQQLEDSAAAAA